MTRAQQLSIGIRHVLDAAEQCRIPCAAAIEVSAERAPIEAAVKQAVKKAMTCRVWWRISPANGASIARRLNW